MHRHKEWWDASFAIQYPCKPPVLPKRKTGKHTVGKKLVFRFSRKPKQTWNQKQHTKIGKPEKGTTNPCTGTLVAAQLNRRPTYRSPIFSKVQVPRRACLHAVFLSFSSHHNYEADLPGNLRFRQFRQAVPKTQPRPTSKRNNCAQPAGQVDSRVSSAAWKLHPPHKQPHQR